MAISAPDIATIRRRTSATEEEFPDDAIAAVYASTSLGNSDLSLTTYYVILEFLGVLAVLVDKSNEVDGMSISASQRFRQVRDDILPIWAAINNKSLTGGSLEVGGLNLAIDTTPADLENPIADWLYG